MSQIITIEDPKDYREGDLFTGWHSQHEGIVTQLTNVPLIRNARNSLYPRGGDWIVDSVEPHYHDVLVTREVPDPPTFAEQFDALEVGDHFKRTDPFFAEFTWVKFTDTQSVMLGRPDIYSYEDWSSTIQIEKVPR